MIGASFARHLRPQPPRAMPRVQLFLQFLSRKIKDSNVRASHVAPNAYGSRLLIEIIKLADIETLLIPGDPYRKIGGYLLSIVKDLEKPIDVRVGRHTPRSLFIHSRRPCFEMITPSRRNNPLDEIPFDQPYNHPDWKTIQPLRVFDMGNCDLKFQVYSDQLQFTNHGPTHAIYSLDCFALVSKFIAYYRQYPHVTNLDQCLLDFVHQEIIVPTLLQDTLAIWLRNIYREQLLSVSRLASYTSTIWDTVNIDTIGSDFTGAMVDIKHLETDLKNQSISYQTVLSSFPLTGSGLSFTDYYRDLYYTAGVPDEQPFAWVDCIKNLGWWEFILTLASCTPDHPDAVSFQRDIQRDVRFWLMMKPWNNTYTSIPLRTMVRSRLEGMYTYLQQT